jgi:hypothetical protein
MESEMAIMKIGRALFIAYSIVSCVLLAPVNVVRADLGGYHIIGDAAHRTVRSSKSVTHVVSLTVMRRSRHRAEIAHSDSRSSSRSAHGALESSAGHELRLSVARLGVLSFMWFDQCVSPTHVHSQASNYFFRLPLRPVTLLLPCVDDFVYCRSVRWINDRPSSAAASRLILA